MISVFEAQAMIRAHVVPLAPESCGLAEVQGRILREPAASTEDMPAFDRSAMDGYAMRVDDTADELKVIGEIRAGDFIDRELKAGEAMRIFTGGRLPGAGLKVVMQENVEAQGERIRIVTRAPETHVRYRGEDARAGEALLEPGLTLDATAVALLASIGKTTVQVSPHPRVLHLTTGDEIVPPDVAPAPGQLRNSNAALIAGLCREYGDAVITHFHAKDNLAEMVRIVTEARAPEAFDLILVSGGSGPGNYDFSAELFRHLGATLHFRQVNVRPGKPLIFGTVVREQAPKIVFGLPGNALSHFACFHLFVRPALDRLLDRPAAQLVRALLTETLADILNTRETWWPVHATAKEGRFECRALPWKSSGDITRLPGANALIQVPGSTPRLDAGTMVELLPTRSILS